jgi:hypothetical protein
MFLLPRTTTSSPFIARHSMLQEMFVFSPNKQ